MKTRTQNVDRRQLLTLGTLLAAGAGLSLVPGLAHATGEVCTVYVAKGYLALRTRKAYDSSNEIGELYTGDVVTVQDASDATYWYVYSQRLGKYGYVNRNYLVAGSTPAAKTLSVRVEKGYLALRYAPGYDEANEIGELYTGDTVQVLSEGGTYWYVYSNRLGLAGYVNKNYLVSASEIIAGSTYTVYVQRGYLALRTEAAYDNRNVIGELYSGDTVVVQSKGSGRYWYVYAPGLGAYGYVDKRYLY